jgi:UDP-3-O-acyl-N-acetylglucosamine deacetylase
VAHRAGHALHTNLAAEILADRESWCLVEAPASVPEAAFDGVPVGARAH